MTFFDWGNVPEWFGAGSLFLAFWIFLRDRINNDRRQVDRIGAWWDVAVSSEVGSVPGHGDAVSEGALAVRLHLRNADDLPVQVARAAVHVYTRAPDAQETRRTVVWGPVVVPPVATWTSDDVSVPVTRAVADATEAGVPGVVTCWIPWTLVIDNAGRVWETRHSRGRRARRLRWYSHRRRDYPYRWLYPGWLRVVTGIAPALRRFVAAREGAPSTAVVIREE